MSINNMFDFFVIRPPYLSAYHKGDVREEPVVSSLVGALRLTNQTVKVFDFHLDRSLTLKDLLKNKPSKAYVIGIRGTGINWRYSNAIAKYLIANTDKTIVFWGQTGKLDHLDFNSERIKVIYHDEELFLKTFNIDNPNNISFDSGLAYYPYSQDIWDKITDDRKSIFKGVIESSRGCHYGCKFCFINHGRNYKSRYLRRNILDITKDIGTYLNLGIKNQWLFDSEFFGANPKLHFFVRDLLTELKRSFGKKINLKIYSRVDTISKFKNYDLLKEAGVKVVLLGIESFNDLDNKALRKSQSKIESIGVLDELRKNEIFSIMSFILFNRASTIDSIEDNLNETINLFSKERFVFLGQLLYFTYNFESNWNPKPGELLEPSSKTKISENITIFNVDDDYTGLMYSQELEPLAEVYRVINYEHTRKLAFLNEVAIQSDYMKEAIYQWATISSLFVLNLMAVALKEFKDGNLNYESIPFYEQWVFLSFEEFNSLFFDCQLQETITNKIGYNTKDWSGWDKIIYPDD